MATCRGIFRHLIRAPFGIHHSYYPLVARRLGSKTDGGGPSDNDIPGNLFEIQDVPLEKQWEENPEFDYTSLVSIPSSYDFVSSQELFQPDELYKLLKQENIRDLVFIKLTANHISEVMVIGSGVSKTHIRSTATLVHKIETFCYIFFYHLSGHTMIWRLCGQPVLSSTKSLMASSVLRRTPRMKTQSGQLTGISWFGKCNKNKYNKQSVKTVT